MTHDQSVHHTKHLHPVFVMAVIGFFFILLFVLFQTMGDRSSNPSERSYPDKEPKAVISTKAEPRFDRDPQQRVGPFRYTSEFLKISFDVPQGYRVEEKLTSINLTNGNENIQISKTATSFQNINEYFENLRVKNNYGKITPEVKINGDNQYLVTNLGSGNTQRRSLFLFKDSSVITITSYFSSNYILLDNLMTSFSFF